MTDNSMKLVGSEWVPLTQEDIDFRAAEELHWETVEKPMIIRAELYKTMRDNFDKKAKELGFDNGVECISYLQSANIGLRTKAELFSEWRDKCHDAHELIKERLINLNDLEGAVKELKQNLPFLDTASMNGPL